MTNFEQRIQDAERRRRQAAANIAVANASNRAKAISEEQAKKQRALELAAGSPLEDYLSEEDIKNCQDFLNLMAPKYRGSDKIILDWMIGFDLPRQQSWLGRLASGRPNIRREWKGYRVGIYLPEDTYFKKKEVVGGRPNPYADHGYTHDNIGAYLCDDGRLRTYKGLALPEESQLHVGKYKIVSTKSEFITDMDSSAGGANVTINNFDWIDVELGDMLADQVVRARK